MAQQADNSIKPGKLSIKLSQDSKFINQDTKYLTSSVVQNGLLDANRVFEIGREISTKLLKSQPKTSAKQEEDEDDDEVSLAHCNVQTEEVVKCLGRIYCEKSKLDNKSCLFIGFDEIKSRYVHLDFSKVKVPLAVIPGQVCLVSGNNPRGDVFYVQEVIGERELEPVSPPNKEELPGSLSIVVASAPFTTEDNLLYDHLDKLMLYCKNNKPDVLILTGAFLSARSPLIMDIATTIDEHFEKMLMGILETVGNETHVLAVSANDDINSSGVYPTHPYRIGRTHPNLHLLPDPCVVDIKGVQIGLTSMDVGQHISEAELTM